MRRSRKDGKGEEDVNDDDDNDFDDDVNEEEQGEAQEEGERYFDNSCKLPNCSNVALFNTFHILKTTIARS